MRCIIKSDDFCVKYDDSASLMVKVVRPNNYVKRPHQLDTPAKCQMRSSLIFQYCIMQIG